MLNILNDPIQGVLKAAESLYPDLECEIQFYPVKSETGNCGMCILPENENEIPQINIDPSIPYGAVLEVLAHELAHVVVPEDDHGEQWDNAFNAIFTEYNRLMALAHDKESCKWMYVDDDGNFVECDNPDATWKLADS